MQAAADHHRVQASGATAADKDCLSRIDALIDGDVDRVGLTLVATLVHDHQLKRQFQLHFGLGCGEGEHALSRNLEIDLGSRGLRPLVVDDVVENVGGSFHRDARAFVDGLIRPGIGDEIG